MAEKGTSGNNLSPPSFNGLCKQGCGFYGNSQSEGMCSKCYKDYVVRQQNKNEATMREGQQQVVRNAAVAVAALTAFPESLSTISSNAPVSAVADASDSSSSLHSSPQRSMPALGCNESISSPMATVNAAASSNEVESATTEEDSSAVASAKKRRRNRCAKCSKKVGLMGFECHCGEVYCSNHRYSDTHQCAFDFQSHGQAQIRRANPQIQASKVEKI